MSHIFMLYLGSQMEVADFGLFLLTGQMFNTGRCNDHPPLIDNCLYRILIPYSHGYEYGPYHHHENLYPKEGYCVTK